MVPLWIMKPHLGPPANLSLSLWKTGPPKDINCNADFPRLSSIIMPETPQFQEWTKSGKIKFLSTFTSKQQPRSPVRRPFLHTHPPHTASNGAKASRTDIISTTVALFGKIGARPIGGVAAATRNNHLCPCSRRTDAHSQCICSLPWCIDCVSVFQFRCFSFGVLVTPWWFHWWLSLPHSATLFFSKGIKDDRRLACD